MTDVIDEIEKRINAIMYECWNGQNIGKSEAGIKGSQKCNELSEYLKGFIIIPRSEVERLNFLINCIPTTCNHDHEIKDSVLSILADRLGDK